MVASFLEDIVRLGFKYSSYRDIEAGVPQRAED